MSPSQRRHTRKLGTEALEDRLLLDARLVADLNLTPQPNGSYPSEFLQVGDEAVLFITQIDHGRQLWRTDGTEGGTWQVFDTPYPDGTVPNVYDLAVIGDTAYFQLEPWSQDLFTIPPMGVTNGTDLETTENLFQYLFSNFTIADEHSFVAVDGTAASRGSLIGVVDASGALIEILYDFGSTTLIGDRLFVNESTRIFVTDGHGFESSIQPFFSRTTIENLIPVGDAAYFFSRHELNGINGLWKTDGDSLELVSELSIDNLGDIQVSNDLLFFAADDFTHGSELWRSDGTPEGTFMVRDINAARGSEPHEMLTFDDKLFFVADDGESGSELWTSDGTTEGTVLFADLAPGLADFAPSGLTLHEGQLYFSGYDDEHGAELWRSDGTPAGTMLAVDIAPGPESSNPVDFSSALGKLYFNASGIPDQGQEPWVSDGTVAGTVSLGNLVADGNQGSLLRALTRVGDSVYFAANDGTHGQELWRSDGTDAGTVMIKDIAPGAASADISEIWNVDGTVYFSASDGEHGMELWSTDGTTAGTQMVADVAPGFVSAGPYDLVPFGNEVYFVAYDADHGEEMWKTDGTAAGTMFLQDIVPGDDGSYPRRLTESNGDLYFVAGDEGDEQLWRTNGVPGQAQLVTTAADLFYEQISSMMTVGDELFFVASSGGTSGQNYDAQLFRTDGPVVREVTSFGLTVETILPYEDGVLVVESLQDFRANPTEYRFWHYDPNSTQLNLLSSFDAGFDSLGTVVPFGDEHVVISVGDRELWVHTLASGESVRIVGTEISEFISPNPVSLTVSNDLLFFVAHGQGFGTELWVSNGTLEGTALLADIATGPVSSFPSSFVFTEDKIFVRADDGIAGEELWSVDLPTVVSFAQPEFVAIEEDGKAGFRLRRYGDVSSSLTVSVEVIGGTAANEFADPPVSPFDYSLPSPQDVTFSSGADEVLFEFDVVDDDIRDPDETIELRITQTGTALPGLQSSATIVVREFDDTAVSPDLNDDQLVDVADLNLLISAILDGSARQLDLNGDDRVDTSDIDAWLELAGAANLPSGLPYPRADVNLDGVVDATDLAEIRLFRPRTRWERGNLNGDRVVDGSDFNIWNEHKFTDHRTPVGVTGRVPRAALASRAIVVPAKTAHEMTREIRAIETSVEATTGQGELASGANTLGENRFRLIRFQPKTSRREIGQSRPNNETGTSITDLAILAVVDDFSISSGLKTQR